MYFIFTVFKLLFISFIKDTGPLVVTDVFCAAEMLNSVLCRINTPSV